MRSAIALLVLGTASLIAPAQLADPDTLSPDNALSSAPAMNSSPAAVIDLPELSPEQLLAQAEAWMDRGLELADEHRADSAAAFSQAATRYDTLVHDFGARNAPILRATGIAKLHAGDTAGAIVALRAAQQLDPTDDRTRESLAAARARVEAAPLISVSTRTRRWLGVWRGYVPRSALLGCGLGLLALGWFVGAANTLWGRPRRLWIATSFILAALPLSVLGYDLWQSQATTHVVLAQEAVGRGGPSSEVYEASFEDPLPAGLEAIATDRRAGWTNIRLASGDETWVRSDTLIGVEALLGQ
ncbi:MAG: hypothetical protein ACI89L_001344 [Phycisphaerales bacterium]|jgi:hypothetical protein